MERVRFRGMFRVRITFRLGSIRVRIRVRVRVRVRVGVGVPNFRNRVRGACQYLESVLESGFVLHQINNAIRVRVGSQSQCPKPSCLLSHPPFL